MAIGFGTNCCVRFDDMFIGMIVKFSGAIIDIPIGWQLCDGTNGTPDLRDKFVIGAGGAYAVGAAGGSVSHAHVAGGALTTPPAAGQSVWENVQSSETNHLPPYYALAQIMKMV